MSRSHFLDGLSHRAHAWRPLLGSQCTHRAATMVLYASHGKTSLAVFLCTARSHHAWLSSRVELTRHAQRAAATEVRAHSARSVPRAHHPAGRLCALRIGLTRATLPAQHVAPAGRGQWVGAVPSVCGADALGPAALREPPRENTAVLSHPACISLTGLAEDRARDGSCTTST